MSIPNKKLTLHRETLTRLAATQESLVHGGITYLHCGTNTCCTCLVGCPGGPTARCSELYTACGSDRVCPIADNGAY